MPTNKAVRTRKSIFTLGKKGDDLDWYAKAVASLQARSPHDPTSWRYMGAVHGYPGHALDPLRGPADKLPSKADQHTFWNQCQHQTWYFLSWHRGYLACFEEIVADAVVQLGGPDGWAIPYWNYSASSAHARELPSAFLDQFDSHGKPNPLWVAGRSMTSAADDMPPGHVDLDALLHSPFEGTSSGGDPGFGGPISGFSHFGGTNGRLESLPHNQVHDDVGGLMSDPNTAALDPIFWVHHANIDRLWEVWNHRDASFLNPTQKAWLSGTSFQLHGVGGKVITFTSSQMQDTLKVRHGYQYDDTSDPFKAPAVQPMVAAVQMTAKTPQPPQLVAASAEAVPLSGVPSTVRVPFNQTERLSAVARVSTRPVRAFLNLENVTGSGGAGSYDVYVNAPHAPAGKPAQEPLLAGHMSTFGVKKASSSRDAHGGSGITTVLEITPLIQQLHQERNWDGQHLDVSFVPYRPKGGQRDISGGTLKVGRISIYYS